MKRIAEPQLMNEPDQIKAYAMANFDQPHDQFIELLLSYFPGLLNIQTGQALDLGCGPADITRRFANALMQFEIQAVDAAENMIKMATVLNLQQGLRARITLHTAYINQLELPLKLFDIIFSNSLLHHLDQPQDIWRTIEQYSQSGTRIFVMDLLRPKNKAQAAHLVQCYAANEPDILQHDFYHSLCAAYRIDEVQQQLMQCGLHYCQIRSVSDRHFIVYGKKP